MSAAGLSSALTITLAATATSARDSHVPRANKIGILRCSLERRQRKQQCDEIENCESQPNFFHGTISLKFAAGRAPAAKIAPRGTQRASVRMSYGFPHH